MAQTPTKKKAGRKVSNPVAKKTARKVRAPAPKSAAKGVSASAPKKPAQKVGASVLKTASKTLPKAGKGGGGGDGYGASDEAVKKATGRGWEAWFALLDKAGAARMKHPQIALLLHERHGVGDWWCQTLTVGYERARGMREKHQKPDGFQVSGSKTVDVPVSELFKAWHDEGLRGRWLGEAIVIRKATPNKSLRVTWVDGVTSVDVNLYPKGAGKSLVSLQHSKIPDREEAEALKAMWAARLGVLKETLEAART
jgi:uncharacterized protein YndB with AHSA1/START domain